MNWFFYGSFLSLALLAIGRLALRLSAYRFTNTASAEATLLHRFSPVSGDRMAQLVDSGDLEFLKRQKGFRSEIGAKWERKRRRIFRGYLRDLAGDFHQLHNLARQIVADSREEHADMVGVLLRQQFRFWRAMTAIEVRLMLPGIAKIDARPLVEALESMRADVARYQAPSAA
jgi:hypothetical protein